MKKEKIKNKHKDKRVINTPLQIQIIVSNKLAVYSD